MIRSITQQKSEAEIDELLDGLGRLFIIGCGTCVTLTQTGGKPEVDVMREKLAAKGKIDKAAKLAKGAKFICRKCARAAASEEHLCAPQKI